jgi:hypothetical protein
MISTTGKTVNRIRAHHEIRTCTSRPHTRRYTPGYCQTRAAVLSRFLRAGHRHMSLLPMEGGDDEQSHQGKDRVATGCCGGEEDRWSY